MSDQIAAPFTPQQVMALNRFQTSGLMHEFTCGVRDEHPDDPGVLVAVAHGWICPHAPCDYEQSWAHDFMADDEALAVMRRAREFLFKPAAPTADESLVERSRPGLPGDPNSTPNQAVVGAASRGSMEEAVVAHPNQQFARGEGGVAIGTGWCDKHPHGCAARGFA